MEICMEGFASKYILTTHGEIKQDQVKHDEKKIIKGKSELLDRFKK